MSSVSTSIPSTGRYTGPAIWLHWLMALLIAGVFFLGLYMADLPMSLTRLKLFNYHKWAGVIVLALAVLRLVWRLTHQPPADVPMPGWQRLAAHGMHHLLYGLFFAVPLVGWAYSSAAGFPIVLFGVLPLPSFVAKNAELAQLIKPWHETLAWTMALLVVMHAGAALKHQFIDKDGLINRMRPGRG